LPTTDTTNEGPTGPYTFFFGPFRFTSEIEIPELRNSRASPAHTWPVTVRIGGVPNHLGSATAFGNNCEVAPTEYLLRVPGTARYYVRDGNEVRVEVEPEVPIADVSTFLLGSIFGVLCHQNGLLPLHASAVERNGIVTAFVGESGAGKSTLAACLQRRGHRIVSDDICLLDPSADAIRVIPVAGWLKLWNQSFQHLGESPDEQHRVFSTDDKFRMYLPASGAALIRLGHVVFLSRTATVDAQPELQPLPIADAIGGLMNSTYVSYVPELMGQEPRVFRTCARVFQQAHPWRLTVPWDLNRIDATLDLIEAQLLNATPTSAS
jgi:hypothetical protein